MLLSASCLRPDITITIDWVLWTNYLLRACGYFSECVCTMFLRETKTQDAKKRKEPDQELCKDRSHQCLAACLNCSPVWFLVGDVHQTGRPLSAREAAMQARQNGLPPTDAETFTFLFHVKGVYKKGDHSPWKPTGAARRRTVWVITVLVEEPALNSELINR